MQDQKVKVKGVTGDDDAASVRASISFPQELYESLAEIARQKKVSLAWVVREATEQYVVDKWPLFGKSLIGGNKQ